MQLISGPRLYRKGASWLFQIGLGHFPVNAYLHRYKHADSARCPASGHHIESAQHFILDFPGHDYDRLEFTKKKSLKDKDSSKIIGDKKFAISLTKYIQATGRSGQVDI